MTEIRRYRSEDEPSWLRCRVLAFLGTSYFDDVFPAKPSYPGFSIELVAVDDGDGDVQGLIDVGVEGTLATIETIAVHPDRARGGLATSLLHAALDLLPADVTVLDAWTREDVAANEWYLANEFNETFRYLHVYATTSEETALALGETPRPLTPVGAFLHGDVRDEELLRSRFARVHQCRRYERPLA